MIDVYEAFEQLKRNLFPCDRFTGSWAYIDKQGHWMDAYGTFLQGTRCTSGERLMTRGTAEQR